MALWGEKNPVNRKIIRREYGMAEQGGKGLMPREVGVALTPNSLVMQTW